MYVEVLLFGSWVSSLVSSDCQLLEEKIVVVHILRSKTDLSG